MPFTIACPNCDAKLKATETLVGKTIKCPRCSKAVLVAQPSQTAVASAPRLELPSTPVEEPEERTDFEDEESEEVDDLAEVGDDSDEEVEEAELDEAIAADDDDDLDRPRKKKRPRRSGAPTQEECQTAMFIYLLGMFTHCIGPIILWMMKREESKFIDHHGKEVINFSITIGLGGLILMVVGTPVVIITFCLGGLLVAPLWIALIVYATVMTIIGAMKANKGEWWEFPISIRLIK